MQTDLALTTVVTTLSLRVAKELAELLAREGLLTAATVIHADARGLAPAIATELRQRARRAGTDSDLCNALAFLVGRWGEGQDERVARGLDTWGANNCTDCACAVFDGHGCGDHRDADEVLS